MYGRCVSFVQAMQATQGSARRPVGVNLIVGNLQAVIEFLDVLTYGAGSTPGLQQNQMEWRAKISHRQGGKAKKPTEAIPKSEGSDFPTP